MGIIKLSKSFKGNNSMNIPITAIISAAKVLPHTAHEDKKIAAKQVRLPATVFPAVNGITVMPNTFPARLAKPSPNARA